MDGSSIVARGAASMSPTSPASSRHGNGGPKRKRSTGVAPVESSPGSFMDEDHADHGEHGDHGDSDKKRQPGVKRACNECRQQKVSHPRAHMHLADADAPFSNASCAATSSRIPSRPARGVTASS